MDIIALTRISYLYPWATFEKAQSLGGGGLGYWGCGGLDVGGSGVVIWLLGLECVAIGWGMVA